MDKLLGGVQLLNGALPSSGVVGLYFSAHWCPPCRGFTPQLAAAYKDIKAADKPFEIIFISSDKDQQQFDSYFAEMPWLGLPFEQRDLKGKLSKKFKVNGIPSLVLLDAKTGKLISTDGRSAISKDPKGEKYPWTPPAPLEALGKTFVGDGKDKSIEGKYVGIYFSAHWCGPCRNFTPKLAETYKKLKAAGKNFEVVFCSADRDQAQFEEYFGSMPWIALPFEDRERAETLNEVRQIADAQRAHLFLRRAHLHVPQAFRRRGVNPPARHKLAARVSRVSGFQARAWPARLSTTM